MTHLHTKFHKSRPNVHTIKAEENFQPATSMLFSILNKILEQNLHILKDVLPYIISGPYTKCRSHFITSHARHIVITDAGMASNAITIITSFVNIGQMVQKLGDTHTQAAKHGDPMCLLFFFIDGN
jgi:hypothetical protein